MTKQKQMTEKELDQVSGGVSFVYVHTTGVLAPFRTLNAYLLGYKRLELLHQRISY